MVLLQRPIGSEKRPIECASNVLLLHFRDTFGGCSNAVFPDITRGASLDKLPLA
ncbi:hypothetical protein M2281_002377 [Mesorhizobium soli]|nr:hypothetical protein [Mesorhizobium soli]